MPGKQQSKRKLSHIDNPVKVGERIRKLRQRGGLSQRQLGTKGAGAAYISRVEAGERVPSVPVIRYLADKLGSTEDYIAYGEGRPERWDERERRILSMFEDMSEEEALNRFDRANMFMYQIEKLHDEVAEILQLLDEMLAHLRPQGP